MVTSTFTDSRFRSYTPSQGRACTEPSLARQFFLASSPGLCLLKWWRQWVVALQLRLVDVVAVCDGLPNAWVYVS